jgi:glycosyltransferase involved in cell wall biosynthesis
MKPKISVLMTVYNQEKFISESIDSVLNQTFPDFEFIIINDGSTDNSLKIIKKFSKLDKRIKIFSKCNSGVTRSLNYGLKKCQANWIARIDADDIADLDRFKIQYNKIKKKKSLVLVGSNCKEIDSDGKINSFHVYPKNDIDLKFNLENLKKFFPHSSYLFSREAAKKINGYRNFIKRSQDYDLSLRLSVIGKIACINRFLVSVRKHSNQVSDEDSGFRQLVDARIALYSHLSKSVGIDDPINTSYENYSKFFNFIKKESYPPFFFFCKATLNNFFFKIFLHFYNVFFIINSKKKLLYIYKLVNKFHEK